MKIKLLTAISIACSLSTFTAEAAKHEGTYRYKIKKTRHHPQTPPKQQNTPDKTQAIVPPPNVGDFVLSVGSIDNGKSIRPRFAYCVADPKGSTKNGGNKNPSIYWSPPPQGTKSLVLLVVDKDVPASFEKANTTGKTIETDEPRQDFYHWVLVNIPPSINNILENSTGIPEGTNSKGITEGGKEFGKTTYGINGQNDYAKMSEGTHGGYDGPCPPWNDNRMHQYHFILYALDIPSVKLPQPIKGAQVAVAIKDHIIAQSEIVGNFSTNPKLQQSLRQNMPKITKPQKQLH